MAESASVRSDQRGTNVDEAIGFYEQVYTSQDLHIGRPSRDGFSWRYRLVGDTDLLVGTSSVTTAHGLGNHVDAPCRCPAWRGPLPPTRTPSAHS